MRKISDYSLLLLCSIVVVIFFTFLWVWIGVDPYTELLDNVIMVVVAGGLLLIPWFVNRFVWKSKS